MIINANDSANHNAVIKFSTVKMVIIPTNIANNIVAINSISFHFSRMHENRPAIKISKPHIVSLIKLYNFVSFNNI